MTLTRLKWQDVTFALGSIAIGVGLIPSLFSTHKPAATTSFVTAMVLTSFLTIYYSYKLWVTFVLTVVSIILWLVLFLQVI